MVYAVIILVRLAMGTGVSGPEVTSMPMEGTATADCPVVGHGSATGGDTTPTVGRIDAATTAVGAGALRRTTVKEPSTRMMAMTSTAIRRTRRRRRTRALT